MIIQTEDEAQSWLTDVLDVSRETMERLECLRAFVIAEAAGQNLVSASTLPQIWQRHIVDSAQLLRFARPQAGQRWIDLGSGAGFPGLVIALLAPCQVTLVESRGLRISYLERAVDHLGLRGQVDVAGMPLERVPTVSADYISARAFAPLPKLLESAQRFSTDKTCWLLPKGRNAAAELESIDPAWHHVFHVEHSLTDADAAILVGTGTITQHSGVGQKRSHRSPS
ncbi:16S rRNA (guanine(527)-N(7))-methyltransferase RsmG [Blastomonas sp.]|uniref:16S rRNA (guanine(527)-N(7))-methyltransferase RsmG n=1 Tax=Blastomonas sp. TaxID=1909299 RepID=UPI0026055905|nr:16S rRNA (guanine(527)-N(7))-methyltransferase RsmG [Blastomonas sp.]MDM7955843.1 16S rRNA (guanine(527)-N(7))-methyltransferase RsmG [Blastomonas sp.]